MAVMQGRVHFYEGYSPQQVIFPMRVMARMGIRAVLLTNAAGGINRDFKQGALVVLRDHINLQGVNPLIGPNEDRFGLRFPDMTQVYWKPYQEVALAGRQATRHSICRRAFTPRCPARAMKRRRRFATCAQLARTWWECPRCPK